MTTAPPVPPTYDGAPLRAAWAYRGASGELLGFVARYDKPEGGKAVVPCFKRNGQGWKPGAAPVPRPLFGLEHLAAAGARTILICEGEKACSALHALGFVAVTSPGGALAAAKADWRPLSGHRLAVVLPDNDPPGEAYAEAVAGALRALEQPPEVLVARLPALPEHGDAVDWIAAELGDSWDPYGPIPEVEAEGLRERLAELIRQEAMPIEPEPEPAAATASVDSDGPGVIDLDAAIAELAKLKPLEYDRQRAEVAERLGVRVGTLDREVAKARGDAEPDPPGSGRALALEDPEPWPDAVDGARLLSDLAEVFGRYLVLAEGSAEALALWTLHTHAHHAARVSPILAVTSPQKRCGKTKTLDVLGPLVRRPLPASNITAAALFRATEVFRPTLLIDEADTFLEQADELRGILNSGHTRSAAFVVRTVGDDHEPRIFTTWAPKAIAMIGRLAGTLADRSIPIRMARKLPGDKVARLTEDDIEALREHARRAARWVSDRLPELRDADPLTPAGLHDRAADNWRPLLAIADVAGGEWPKRARGAIGKLVADDDADEAAPVLLLGDIRELFLTREVDRLPSADIAEALGKREDRPWPEWKHGKPITARQVAALLRAFRIVPVSTRMPDGKTPKGYHLGQFTDAWERYLPQDPPSDPPHRHNPSGARVSAENEPPHADPAVADVIRPKPNSGAACGDVADENGVSGADAWIDEEAPF